MLDYLDPFLRKWFNPALDIINIFLVGR